MDSRNRSKLCFSLCLACVVFAAAADGGEKALTFEELMKFRQIRGAVISDDGSWIAYGLEPDRGDGEVVVRSTAAATSYRVDRGAAPEISADGRWAVSTITPTLEEREKKPGKKKAEDDDKPREGLSILDLDSGSEERIEGVEKFALSGDGRWVAYRLYEEKKESPQDEADTEGSAESGPETEAASEEDPETSKERRTEKVGTTLKLRNLIGGGEATIEHVREFGFAETASLLVYSVSAPEGVGNGIFLRDLGTPGVAERTLHAAENGRYTELTWARDIDHLAFVAAVVDDDGEAGDAEVWAWTGGAGATRLVAPGDAPEGFIVPSKNELQWSRDGARLFFGFKPAIQEPPETPATEDDGEGTEFDPYDLEGLLEKREVDVWHWNDPLIISNQKERWNEEKDRVYRAVVHLENGRVVPLADLEMAEVFLSDNPRTALGLSDVPYRREVTWDGRYLDLYAVDLQSGERTLLVRRLAGGRSRIGAFSPDGRFVLYWDAGDWHLFDIAEGESRNLTADLGVGFANEDHDYPSDPPGYGHSEWLADSSAILIYDKYDIWQFYVDDRAPITITGGEGRKSTTVFRVVDLDPEEETLAPGAPVLLEAYHDLQKHDAFYTGTLGGNRLKKLVGTGEHRYEVIAKAKAAGRILLTRERYDEFPDLWVGDMEFDGLTRLTDANPQIADYAWGSAELVEWTSADGIGLQGVLIKPGNYEAGQRYPVLVYYYRFSSQRLNLFNEPVVNHRPSFPVYASNGYAVFLPDIRFEVGRPGFSATKCLVPGVQKLVDIGVADPAAIGLHGHSWSGYQTAFVVTQTDIFAAAVAGAPVSNMTSAYSGIRWGTGLARQFQYEKSQSRIGGSLWEYPERYIENSPVFFADRIDTPLLIQHGDEDGAVPWYQSIELYLACRRLDKNCIFLQYRGEPHHLKKYANKLDYSIKMKEFFDHWLKGVPAPQWMTEGVPYRGK